MVSKSPETISYNSISTVFTNGETVETKTVVSGISCFVEKSSKNYRSQTNGDVIAETFVFYIYDRVSKDKVPVETKYDTITYKGIEYKIISLERYQKHIIIRV